MKTTLSTLACILFAMLGACSKKDTRPEIWIYTSTYKEVIATFEEPLAKFVPEAKIQWFQGGSEVVAQRVLTEIASGGTKADLLMSSDPFFFEELAQKNLLHKMNFSQTKLPPEDIAPSGLYAITRFPVMVIAWNKKLIKPGEEPKSFQDLLAPKWKSKVTMPSPMESGTALSTILFLHDKFGESYFQGLRKNEILAAGGNGAVMSRLQSGERPVGIILMENILQAREKKSDTSVDFTVPLEGAIPIPSPMAAFASTKNPALTEKVFSWFMTPEAQTLLVKSWIYSAIPGSPPPLGGPEWSSLKLMPWNMKTLESWTSKRLDVRESFRKTVLQ